MEMIATFLEKFKKSCSTCSGSGMVTCHCNANDEIICPHCLGSGSVKKPVVVNTLSEGPCDNPSCRDGLVKCSLCKGSGIAEHGEQCPQCTGSGRTTCPICEGLNRITGNCQETWFKNAVCPVCHGAQVIPCPYCHGSKNRICSTCSGTGRVWAKGKITVSLGLLILIAAMPLIFITLFGFALAGWSLHTACQYFPPKRGTEDEGQSVPNDQKK